MSSEPSAKRQRINAQGLSANPRPAAGQQRLEELNARLESLPHVSLLALAKEVCLNQPFGPLALAIDGEHARITHRERTRAVNFDHYSKSAWYEMNQKYAKLSGSRQYDAAGDAQSAVADMLNTILEKTKEHSSYPTKKSAVETMRKIFKSLLLANDVVGHEIRKDCWDWDNKFLRVLGKFTEEDLQRLATEDDGAWVEKLREVVGLANGYCILEKLQESLDDLEAYQAGDKNENGDNAGTEEAEDGGDEGQDGQD